MCLDLAVSCPSRCVLADGKKVPQACRAVNLSQSFSGTDSVFRFATLRERTCQSPSRPYRRRDGIAEWCKPLGNRTGSRSRGQTAFFASLRYAKERVSPRRGRTGGETGSPSGASLWGIAPDLDLGDRQRFSLRYATRKNVSVPVAAVQAAGRGRRVVQASGESHRIWRRRDKRSVGGAFGPESFSVLGLTNRA